jgi:hypothetical protein
VLTSRALLVGLRLLGNPKRALLSQLPMLALMIIYTIFSLWLISQPIIVVDNAAATENVSQPAPSENLREPPMPDRP